MKLGCWADGWLAGLSGCRHMIDSPQHHHHHSIATTPMALEEIERIQTANCLAFDGWMGDMISRLATPEFPLLRKASLIYCRAIVSVFLRYPERNLEFPPRFLDFGFQHPNLRSGSSASSSAYLYSWFR